jgi:ATP/maltotriose-dependent transcriptional regulator MalT
MIAGARAAAAVSSRRESFELYRRAIANLPDDLPAAERAAVYEGYAEAGMAVDDVPATEGAATLARRAYLEAGDALNAANALVLLASVARRDVRPATDRFALLDQAEAELITLPDTPERALYLSDVVSFRATCERDAGRLDDAAALYAEAIRLRRASTDTITADIDYMAAEVVILQGHVQEGLDTMLEIARGARVERHEAVGVTAFRWAAAMAIQQQQYEQAELGVREGLRYADEIQQSYCRHVLAATSAHLAWVEGRWDDAVSGASLERVEPGSRRGGLGSRDVLAFVSMGRGDVAHARELLAVSLEIGRSSGELDLLLPTLWGTAETDLIAGDAEAAFTRCEEALALAGGSGLRHLLVPFVVTGARAALAVRRPVDAERWLAEVEARLEGFEALAQPAVDHASGLVRLASGSTGAARAALAGAVGGWDARGRIWEATWARLDLATCLVRMNRHADALPLLREAETTANRLGSAPLLERARTMLARARSRAVDDEPWRPLTVREFEVARLVAKGWTNHEIADELQLAPRTVNAHLEHILGKLGVGRRAEVAAWVSGIDSGAGAEAVAARR